MMEVFARFARVLSNRLAHPAAFLAALLAVLIWAACGPFYGYSSNWQLVINTGTTILTFLMVFVLQNTQNRDGRALQVKLNELLRAVKGARNELIDLENLTEEELVRYCDEFRDLHEHCRKVLKHRRRRHPR
ncbi:MAG: putative small integral rane protein precursor [Verrucomicrobia bacterium]|nr:putative small integral rane protein precursor [Verrucomicrobiota bacterium]